MVPRWAVDAERALSTIASPPPLTARALASSPPPSFAALHAAVGVVLGATGFGRGLFTDDELAAERLQTAVARELGRTVQKTYSPEVCHWPAGREPAWLGNRGPSTVTDRLQPRGQNTPADAI